MGMLASKFRLSCDSKLFRKAGWLADCFMYLLKTSSESDFWNLLCCLAKAKRF